MLTIARQPRHWLWLHRISKPSSCQSNAVLIVSRGIRHHTITEQNKKIPGFSKTNIRSGCVANVLHISNPTNADYKTVIAQLPELTLAMTNLHSSALFFATPGLAKWFASDHPFHMEAINEIYPPSDYPPESAVTIIDALPHPSSFTNFGRPEASNHAGCEGIAVYLIPGHVTSKSAIDEGDKPSLIHFRSNPREEKENSITNSFTSSIILPAANTLFTNGRRSTMFKQSWKTEDTDRGKRWTAEGPVLFLSDIDIPVHQTPRTLWHLNSPLEPITPARKIISSMGNVLREVTGDQGEPIKASTELEAKVPEYIERKSRDGVDGNVQVFAIIRPLEETETTTEPLANLSGTEADTDVDKDGEKHKNSVLDEKTRRNGLSYNHTFWAGGRILRVTGGGGGWGKKQGLLSLETVTGFTADSDANSGMFPSLEDDMSADGTTPPKTELLPSGYTIQFCAVLVPANPKGYYARRNDDGEVLLNWAGPRWSSKGNKLSVVVGTSSGNETSISENTQDKITVPTVQGLPGRFGMLSYGGCCLSLESSPTNNAERTPSSGARRVIHESRFDVPNSIFNLVWIPPPEMRFMDSKWGRRGMDTLLSPSQADKIPGSGPMETVFRKVRKGHNVPRLKLSDPQKADRNATENIVRKFKVSSARFIKYDPTASKSQSEPA